MKTLYINNVNFGVYSTIEVAGDRLITDNSEYPISVIGSDYQIVEGAEYPPVVEVVEVPQSITPRQLRLALLDATLLDEVEAMVATDRAMGIWWEYSLDIERNNEYIINAGLALGLTEKQIDDLFISASKL